jgi:hypothetical protein
MIIAVLCFGATVAAAFAEKPATEPATAPVGMVEEMRAALALPDRDAAIAVAEKIIKSDAKGAEAALYEIVPRAKDPARSRGIYLLAKRPDTSTLLTFFLHDWPVKGTSTGRIDLDALQAVLEMPNGTAGSGALDKLLDGRQKEAESAMIEVYPRLSNSARQSALFWFGHRPDMPGLRELLMRQAGDGDLTLRSRAVEQLTSRCGNWPADQKPEIVKLALARLGLKNEKGGNVALWLARQGVTESVPLLKARLELLAKLEGPAARYEVFGIADGLNSRDQGKILVAMAILGDPHARHEILDSLAQDMDSGRLAWGIWAAWKMRDPSWVCLVAEHLDDARTVLNITGFHPNSEISPPRKGQSFRLRIDALAVQVLAGLCQPALSFKPDAPGGVAGYKYPPIPHPLLGDWEIIPQGYSPAEMREARDWWARNRNKWSARPVAPATRPAP